MVGSCRAGPFFVLGFDGFSVPKSLTQIHQRHGLGGVILFDRNIESPTQVRNLNHALRKLSPEKSLIISIDEEGGRFQKLKAPVFGQYPRACDVDSTTALAVARKMGAELHDLGFNFDNAPVLDVNTNPGNPIIGERSFGSDPRRVAEVGRLFIQGLQENGVLACGKHFPGHGDTSQDSHLTLPVVNHSKERLHSVELLPFRELIKGELKCLMTAHVLYPALDEKHPATFSAKILDELLRKEFGYDGMVVTDDMGMAGSLSQADLPEACIQAFAAGCDLLLVCEHPDRHEAIIAALETAIEKSPVLQKRAEESLERKRNFPLILQRN